MVPSFKESYGIPVLVIFFVHTNFETSRVLEFLASFGFP